MTKRMFKEMAKTEVLLFDERNQGMFVSLAIWLHEIKHIYVK